MDKRIARRNINPDCRYRITEYLTPLERAMLERTCTSIYMGLSYTSKIQEDRDSIEEIKNAILNLGATTPCTPKMAGLICHYAPYARGTFNHDLNKYITSQLSLLEVEQNALFNLLSQTPDTDEARVLHTTQVTTLLNQNPIIIYANDNYGATPLHWAAKLGDLRVVKSLLDKGPNVNAPDKDGNTPLHLAAKNGHTDIAELLCADEDKVNAKNNRGNTPLHWAAIMGKLDTSKSLLANKADVNTINKYGYTPLHVAALEGNLEIVTALLEHAKTLGLETLKAVLTAENNNDLTPQELATVRDHTDIAQLLVQEKRCYTRSLKEGKRKAVTAASEESASKKPRS